ncbi:MAG: DoxX family protein [Proteobacteria bacterium]|nr:DoxX family protein [Pseudomonadota bacterium]
MHRLMFPALARFEDVTWLLLRVVTGTFLVHGTWDNIASGARMIEFVQFLEKYGFWQPALMAPLSVWAQFLAGLALLTGTFTRVAGAVIAFNFIVAVVMVHWALDFRGWWPALILVFIGLHAMARGSGTYGVDAFLEKR